MLTMVLECSEDEQIVAYKKLLVAKLYTLVADLRNEGTTEKLEHRPHLKREAREYALDESQDPWSLWWICEHLGVDYDWLWSEVVSGRIETWKPTGCWYNGSSPSFTFKARK